MGLLDALFGDNGSGGLLGGLPREWQYQNPKSQGFGGPIFANNQSSPLDTAPWPAGPAGDGKPADFASRFDALPNAPQAFVPSGRQFERSQFDPATFAPNQAGPIAVGNYQMPRMGSSDLYQPQQAMTPPEAQPTQGFAGPGAAQSPPAVQAAFMQPPVSSGFGSAARGALANLHNGPLGLIAGALAGGLGMGQGNPLDIQRQNQQAQYQAFIGAGLSPQNAMLAVLNPEAGKTLINEALTNKEKYGVISEDPLQGKRYGFINERDQTVNGRPINSDATSQMMGLDGLQRAQQAGVTGDQLYEYLPKSMAPVVKAMVEGRQPLPSTTAMRSPATLALIDAAHSIDPSFDATSWGARVKGMNSFKSGADAGTVRSANQVLGHISDLTEKADKLGNGSYPLLNRIGNAWSEQTGSDAPNNWVTQAHAVADELSSFMKGAGHSSDTEIKQWKDSLSPNMSPQQQRGAISTLMGIYDHALSALEDKRTGAIGPAASEKMGPLISVDGQAAMNKVKKWAAGENSETAPAAPAGAPAPGAYVWSPGKGLSPK